MELFLVIIIIMLAAGVIRQKPISSLTDDELKRSYQKIQTAKFIYVGLLIAFILLAFFCSRP